MALITCIGDTPLADAFAKSAAEALVATYPNHSWWVECKQGVLIIKHLEASGVRGIVGMLRKMDQLQGQEGTREIVRAAGEMLERAGFSRGGRTEDPVDAFEMDSPEMDKYWHKPLQTPRIH